MIRMALSKLEKERCGSAVVLGHEHWVEGETAPLALPAIFVRVSHKQPSMCWGPTCSWDTQGAEPKFDSGP